MKEFLSYFLVVVMLLSVVGLAGVHAESAAPGRYFVESNNGVVRAMVGVQHAFDNGFTTELTEGQYKALTRLVGILGITVVPVEKHHILKPPGSCTPWPSCKNSDGGDPGDGSSVRTAIPSDQTPWGIEAMYGDAAIATTSGGAGVAVAVLDTGVDVDHIDLVGRAAQCKDFTKRGVREGCSDGNGHGTHVAGTILADGGADSAGVYGMAPEASLYAYRVCGNSGSCWSDDIAAGIRHAADEGAEIISLSIGSDQASSLIVDAIEYAVTRDVLVVAAAGNDGPTDGSIDYPGALASVVAVGAVDGSMQVPSWSSRGVNDGDYIIEEREVEFAAPGVAIESTWNNGEYHVISGTSMATPHVSGMAAKHWQGSASATRAYLHSLAQDIAGIGDDTATGFGIPVSQ